MFFLPPTKKSRELALLVRLPGEQFIREQRAKNLWMFSGDIKTREVRNILRYYYEELKPVIETREASQGRRIDGERFA